MSTRDTSYAYLKIKENKNILQANKELDELRAGQIKSRTNY